MKISEKCRGCGICLESCPENAIIMKAGKALIKQNLCVDCGLCINDCPFNLIANS